MGRHAAGHGYLRAAVADRDGQALWAYTPKKASAEIFGRLVREMDPAAEARWLPPDRLDLLGQSGTLYLPGPGLGETARLRLRAGCAAFSLCGITHTTATHRVMDAITGLLSAPVMPWDALICTSRAVAATVDALLEEERRYLAWRFGAPPAPQLPLLPVIPLGVHTSDFVFSDAERAAARRDLGIAEDEVVALFLGRLSFHAKAHPYQMYRGLEAAARRSGRKIALVQCGWFGNAPIEAAFRDGAAAFCPTVRALFTDGRDAAKRRQSWAAADLFLSLSDNVQETFGLSPIEAMAAGLPVVVTDWDGYRDSVRDGVDGYRIATRMPAAGFGEGFARGYEAGAIEYDLYVGYTCQAVSLDLGRLTECLSELVSLPERRRQLGEAGRRRAVQLFDWSVVYRRYRELWAELAAMRRAAPQDPQQQRMLAAAPRMTPSRPDPYLAFARYPTAAIEAATRVEPVAGAHPRTYRELKRHPLFTYADRHLPAGEIVEAVLAAVAAQPDSVAGLAGRVGLDLAAGLHAVAVLAKMGLVELPAPAET